MATQAAARETDTSRVTGRESVAWPSRIPANTLVGVYDGRLAALDVAKQLREAHPRAQVWLASGSTGAELVRAAQTSFQPRNLCARPIDGRGAIRLRPCYPAPRKWGLFFAREWSAG